MCVVTNIAQMIGHFFLDFVHLNLIDGGKWFWTILAISCAK